MFEQSPTLDGRKGREEIKREAVEQCTAVTEGILELYQRRIFAGREMPFAVGEMKRVMGTYLTGISFRTPEKVILLHKLLQLEQLKHAEKN